MKAKVYDWHTVFGFSDKKFLLTFGVSRTDFLYMLTFVEKWLKERATHPNGGHPFVLKPYDYLAITLLYMRQYHTMDSMADEWGVSKGAICKVYNSTATYLATSGKFRLLSDKDLSDGDIVVVDATESPINRPKKRPEGVLFRQEKASYDQDPDTLLQEQRPDRRNPSE